MAWLAGWARRKAITLSTPAALLSAFPFPARITADTDVGALAQATGYDIRFTLADGTTLLDHERDTFAVTAGAATGLWWVEIPSWSALVATTIYMYYGKADAPDVSSGPNTFDSNHVGVYHGGDGSTLSVQDSSQAGNHGTNNGATAAAGIAGGALRFDGGQQGVQIPYNASLYSPAMSVSLWVKSATADYASNAYPVAMWDFATNDRMWAVHVRNGNYKWGLYTSTNGTTLVSQVASQSVTTNWMHVAVTTADGGNTWLMQFDGGASETLSDLAGYADQESSLRLGALWNGSAFSNQFSGLLDEVRISNIARSAAWLAAEYGTVAAPATWQTWGAEESKVTARPWLYAARRSQIIGAGA